MPYATTFDDVKIEAVPPCLIRTTTELLLEALATLWDAYDEDTKHKEGDIAHVEVAAWESVTKSGGKKYFRPRFTILGYIKGLEEQVRRRRRKPRQRQRQLTPARHAGEPASLRAFFTERQCKDSAGTLT